MPQTSLHVASATIAAGSKWLDETHIVGPADDLFAAYSSSGADSAALTLTFEAGDIPANAVIGNIAVRLWGSWSGSGEPAAVIVTVGSTPNLEFIVNETPGMHEVSDGVGWSLTPPTLNALEGTLSLSTSSEEIFAFDAIEVAIDWEVPAPPPISMSVVRRARILGII
jgi:hypothetical protein